MPLAPDEQAEPQSAPRVSASAGDETRQIESSASFRQVTDPEDMKWEIIKAIEAFEAQLKAMEDRMVTAQERLERLRGGGQNQ
ncbi:UNVERIFIED_CONTAM: hypothetical protein K2H54_061669 [Gekko kuhli]